MHGACRAAACSVQPDQSKRNPKEELNTENRYTYPQPTATRTASDPWSKFNRHRWSKFNRRRHLRRHTTLKLVKSDVGRRVGPEESALQLWLDYDARAQRMNTRTILMLLTLVLCLTSRVLLAADRPMTFAAAKKIWEQTKNRKEYQTYTAEFAQFNNHFRLDERNGCYGISKEPVELMLVITHRQEQQYALIEGVLSNVDSPKALCFKKSYIGIQTKVPPFLPFVMQMSFDN